jgi:predicted transcriptional regulator
MADEMLLDHVADIVSAHVSNNSVAAVICQA